MGPWVCAWIEQHLVHSTGDYFGRPFRLRKWQKALLWEAYELEGGQRKYDQVLLGLPKGSGKTELAAAISCCELAGPVVPGSARPSARLAPDIPIAAASFEQADELFGSSRVMISEGPLAPLFDVFDTEIMPKNGPGRMYRVAAATGTNDGKRPTFFVADELHEWVGNKERVHLILSNGRMKRAGAWELNISTAGWDLRSLLGRLYMRGRRIQAGEELPGKFLFRWYVCGKDYDLSKADQLRKAIEESSPAYGDFISVDAIIQRYREIAEFEFRRYYLNQFTAAPDRWIDAQLWDGCHMQRQIPNDVPVVIGFDGSYSGDSTAVVGCTVGERPHLFVIDAWEKDGRKDWRVDVPDVEQTVRNVCSARTVRIVGCDPHRWQRSLAVLEEEGLPIVKWPSHSAAHMSPACQEFERAVKTGALTHDGDERLADHIGHCMVKIDSRGPRITKDHKDSERKIDIAVAAVIAHDLALRQLNASEYTPWGPAETDEIKPETPGPIEDFIPIQGW